MVGIAAAVGALACQDRAPRLCDAIARCAKREGPERWVFIRGFHNSGTSLTDFLLQLHDDVVGINGKRPPSAEWRREGQHNQDVFPVDSHNPEACPDDTYRCPTFVSDAMSDERWGRLCYEWLDVMLEHGDLEVRPLLVEKSPNMMLRFLSGAARQAGTAVVVLRHPFGFHYKSPIRETKLASEPVRCPPNHASPSCVALWLAVWIDVLRDLSDSALRGWVVFRFESLAATSTPDLHARVRRLLDAIQVDDRRFRWDHLRLVAQQPSRRLRYRRPDVNRTSARALDVDTTLLTPNGFFAHVQRPIVDGPCRRVADRILDVFHYDVTRPRTGFDDTWREPVFLASARPSAWPPALFDLLRNDTAVLQDARDCVQADRQQI